MILENVILHQKTRVIDSSMTLKKLLVSAYLTFNFSTFSITKNLRIGTRFSPVPPNF